MAFLRYIYLADLMRFMGEDEALKALSLFEGAQESKRVSRSCLKEWVVMKSAHLAPRCANEPTERLDLSSKNVGLFVFRLMRSGSAGPSR